MTDAAFTLYACLYEGASTVVYRAIRASDGAPVILKMLRPDSSSAELVERLQHEHDLLSSLDVPGVIRSHGLCEHEGVPALVLEDVGGETLESRISEGKLERRACLVLALRLAEALGRIHGRGVLHKDINPRNILVDPSDEVWIIDLSVATRLPREIQGVRSPNALEGTLAYISPEQTGRMNRLVDHRSDLYSLGATMYAMLVGRPPFVGSDPMELVHAHIARRPVPPADVDPSVPAALSDIVMKLLSKAAEDRYKSALGLASDLEECLRRMDEGGRVDPFPLGRRDPSDRLTLPQRLYGRDAEIAALEAAFERAAAGSPELVLVGGASGIGKSALVHEIERSLVGRRGLFAAGKCEDLASDMPYGVFLQAFREVLQYLLAESEESLASYRSALWSAVGGAGRVLADVLPALALILGEQGPAPELPPADARNRFHRLVQSFIHVFTRKGRALVLFLDDLQWVDPSSLDLLSALLGDRKAGSLLVLGTYRDAEVPASHPLVSTVAGIEAAGCRVTRLSLGPLPTSGVTDLVADTFDIAREEARPLAEIVRSKTQGNPLFVGELLATLHKTGLISLEPQRLRYTWDLAEIERAPVSDNIVNLLVARVQLLSPRAQEALLLAACIGNRFDLATLAIAADMPREAAAEAIEEAAHDGLIVPSAEGHAAAPRVSYRFHHDRVQQAAYWLIPALQWREVHLRIGRLLVLRYSEEELGEKLFTVVDQLNFGAPLITEAEERRSLARLNLRAGRRAKASAAFQSAARYLSAGASALPEGAWETDCELAFAIHRELAECTYVSGDHIEAERLCLSLLERARTKLDKASVYRVAVSLYFSMGAHRKAAEACVECVEELGVGLPAQPDGDQASDALRALFLRLRDRRIEDLIDLPQMEDAEMIAAMGVLATSVPAAFYTSSDLLTLFACRMVELSASYGNADASASGYAILGSVLCARGDYLNGYAFGKLACDLVDKRGLVTFKPDVFNIFAGTIAHWTHHVNVHVEYSRAGCVAARETGNLIYGSFLWAQLVTGMLFRGDPLAAVDRECATALDFTSRAKLPLFEVITLSVRRLTRNLQGLTAHASTFSGDGFDQGAYEERLRTGGLPVTRAWYLVMKLKARVIFGELDEAGETAAEAREVLPHVASMLPYPMYVFYAALAAAGRVGRARGQVTGEVMVSLGEHEAKLRVWAESCPENFLGKHALVEAEIARIKGEDAEAARLYDKAIRAFRASGFGYGEALSNEIAARFYADRGFAILPAAHRREARAAYLQWGAHGKVRQLEEQHPELQARAAAPASGPITLRPASVPGSSLPPPPRSTWWPPEKATSSSSKPGAFDLPSIIKASQALSGEISLDKLLTRLMSVAVENAGAERGALILKRGQALRVEAEVSAEGGARIPERPLSIEESPRLPGALLRYVARTQKSVVLRDAAGEGAFTRDPYIEAARPKSLLCMPLVHQGALKGLLFLENNLTAGAFTDDRAELLSVLCSQMAISIENAYLYADLEKIVAERTRELRGAQARLIALERDATEAQMAGGFAHEMRNTLTGAKMLLRRASGADDGAPSLCAENSGRLMELYLRIKESAPPEARAGLMDLLRAINTNEEILDTVLSDLGEALDRALATTNQILDYARLGRERPGADAIRLLPLVEEILRQSEGDIAANGIAVELDIGADVALTGKEVHVYSILKNLILNAIHALMERDAGEARALRISAAEGPDRCELRVIDTGAGIPAEIRGRIFEPFFSTKTDTGTGLGLGVVRKLVALYGGTIDVDSEVGRGTTMAISLPRSLDVLPSSSLAERSGALPRWDGAAAS